MNNRIGKLVCVGRNYAKHAQELGNEVPKFPLIFLKPSSAIIPSGGTIVMPTFSKDVHHEIELIVEIGKTVKHASEEEAVQAIVGYGVGLDMTARDLQNELIKNGQPWALCKGFDTSAVLSQIKPVEAYNPSFNEVIELRVNGEVRQRAVLNEMIFSPAKIISHISHYMKLEEGDIIFTGTPQGVGPVNEGDILEGFIENIGSIKAEVKRESVS